jgi:hypothetical protein
MSLSSRLRRVAALVTALAAIACVGVLSGALAFAPRPEDPNERLALRLPDLPPGYVPLDIGPEGTGIEFLCEGIDPTDPSPKLAEYDKRFDPVGCLGIYLRLFQVPGPATTPSVVGTGAMRANHLAGAIAGFDAAGELLGKLVEEKRDLEEVAPQATVGETTRLFHWNHLPKTFLDNDRLGSFLVWRSGRVVSAAFAAAPTFADSDRIALELAQRQQAHVEHPTVYTNAERDSSEVALDNPEVTFPVRWLGKRFSPGHGLPTSRLTESGAAVPPLEGGPSVYLQYRPGPNITEWTAAQWRRSQRNPGSGLAVGGHCRTATQVPVPGGHAVVYGFSNPRAKTCEGPPEFFFAFVFVEGTVIGVKFPAATSVFAKPGPYDSLRALKALVRGLKLRPKPVFSAQARR